MRARTAAARSAAPRRPRRPGASQRHGLAHGQGTPPQSPWSKLRTLLADLASEDLDPNDPAGRDPEFIKAVAPFFEMVGTYYFRTATEEVQNVPTRGPFIAVANHNGGPLLPDVWLMLAYWAQHMGADLPAYAMVHDAAFRVPLVKNFLVKVGGMRATRENAEKVLRMGGALLVYPGGELDCYRTFWDRNKINLHGRTGFIELAYKYGVPILPVVNIGAHEVYFTLFSSRRLARWTGIEKLTRVKTVPLTVGLPWGIWLTGFLPYLPLPSKFVYRVGRPIDFPRRPDLAGDQAAVRRVYAQITSAMQQMLDDLASRRRFPVIG
jgi:1-acyl-sn-glycerol-3-phosphate acyltransferase